MERIKLQDGSARNLKRVLYKANTICCHTAGVRAGESRHSFQAFGVFMLAAVTAVLALGAGFFGFGFFGACHPSARTLAPP